MPFVVDVGSSQNEKDATDAPSGEGTAEFVPGDSVDDDDDNNNNNSSSSVVISSVSSSSSDDNSTLTVAGQQQQQQEQFKPKYDKVIVTFDERMKCEPWMFPQEPWERMLNDTLAQIGVTGLRWTHGYDRQHIRRSRRRKLQINAGCPDFCTYVLIFCGCGCISGINCPGDEVATAAPIPITDDTGYGTVHGTGTVYGTGTVDGTTVTGDGTGTDDGTGTGDGTGTVDDTGTSDGGGRRERHLRGRDLELEEDDKKDHDEVSPTEAEEEELRMQRASEEYEKLQKRYEDYYHPNGNGNNEGQDERRRTAQVAQFIKDEETAQNYIDLDLSRLGMDVECLKRQDDGQYHARIHLMSNENEW